MDHTVLEKSVKNHSD
ncbi:Protein of unknown function [Pyronema omphalodes CBS 100304]|uniref:Uncharacterized protein n=1 Tax=Pyronema omphalodes (strain CBS 100304) TaxID=1076935 RepID=U4KUZ2_PYROM|nr:Protein of unknown function [Pyronema omphalodes CBS 100304]